MQITPKQAQAARDALCEAREAFADDLAAFDPLAFLRDCFPRVRESDLRDIIESQTP